MTESECKEQSERLEKYRNMQDKISVIVKKKSQISSGIISIKCMGSNVVDFDYLGDDFRERLTENILSLLDSEIETIKKSMETI